MTDNIMCPISQTPHQRTIWFLFALVMVVLTWMMFGSLFAFPINEIAGDEQDTFHDIRLITEDPLNLISNSRRMPIRPLWDVIILIVYHLGQDQAVAYHTLSIVLHLLASLFLAYTFWRLGADLELSFLSALLFLINIAHFRTVHWFINTNYILAFIVGIGMLLTWVLFLESNQKRWQISASGLLLVAVFTHPSAVAATLFCFYLTWRKRHTIRHTVALCRPLILTALVSGLLAYLVSPHHGQTQGLVAATDWTRLLTNPLWYIGRLITSAHWLPPVALTNQPHPWEIGLGLLAGIGVLALHKYKAYPATDWAVWSLLMVLPFINNSPDRLTVGPSRQLYFASAGACFVLAWGIRTCIHRTGGWLNQTSRRTVFAAAFLGLMASSLISFKTAEAVSLYVLGRSYVASKAFQKGLEQFERAVEIAPQAVPLDVYFRLAAISFSQGTWPHETFENIRKIHPDVPELTMLSGVAAFLSDDIETQKRGEAAIHSATEQASDKELLRFKAATAYQNLASYFHRNQNHKKAVVLYRKALALRPGYPTALFNFANALYRLGHVEDAIRMMEQAARAESVREQALRRLGLMRSEQGR